MNFYVGQRVQFKDWDEMVNEFGTDCFGNIDCRYKFPEEMEHLCGRTAVIDGINEDRIFLREFSISPSRGYAYSIDMIKPYAENKVADIATLFGVDIDEEFDIINKDGTKFSSCPYKFTTEDCLVDKDGFRVNKYIEYLATSKCEVKKLPWKPKYCETYFYIDKTGKVVEHLSTNELFDIMCFKLGNFFKTKEEAEKNKDKIIKMLKENSYEQE